MIDIANNIKTFRQAKNLTQRQLSEKLNVSERTVQNWEAGKSKPTIDILIDLCKALDVTPNEFCSYESPTHECDYIVKDGKFIIETEKNRLKNDIYNQIIQIAEEFKKRKD